MVQRLKAPFENETTHIVIGASIGVASATRSSDPGELTRRADIALYHAKAAGRNTYDALFGEHMDELLRRRRALKKQLTFGHRDPTSDRNNLPARVYSKERGTLLTGDACALEPPEPWSNQPQPNHPAGGGYWNHQQNRRRRVGCREQ